MAQPAIKPYGSWPSPITMDMVVAGNRALFEARLDGDDIYVLEARPDEAGRVVLLRRSADGTWTDVTPTGYNVRTRVHEYGGGEYAVSGGLVVFSNFQDNRLYRQRAPDAQPEPLTAPNGKRFADLVIDRPRDRVIAVMEDHDTGDDEPRNSIVAVSLADARERP
jgi:hypothetical protein